MNNSFPLQCFSYCIGIRKLPVAIAFSLVGLCIHGLLGSNSTQAGIYEDRANYRQAKYALEIGRTSEYRKLRGSLDNYVLSTYLNYFEQLRRLSRISPDEALQLRKQFEDLSLGDRFYRRWLNEQARRKRWQTYADYYEESYVVTEKCWYLQALFHTKQNEAALLLVPQVWVYGKSQPKECDMPFNRWIAAKRVSNELAWQRLELALQEKQRQLSRYLLRFFTKEVRGSAETLIRVDRSPKLTNNQNNFKDDLWGRAALRFGLFKLMRSDAVQAESNWRKINASFDYRPDERTEIEDELGFWLSREGIVPSIDKDLTLFSTRTLSSVADTLIAENNWKAAQVVYGHLDDTEKATDKWRYWFGVIQLGLGVGLEALSDFKQLATERSYYGFLAAHDQGQPSRLNAKEATLSEDYQMQVLTDARVNLIMELFAVGDSYNAREEWKFLQANLSESDKLFVVKQFAEVGLTYDAIYTANDAGAHDALDVRFPMPYLHEFKRNSHETNIDMEYLLGIARQESAFNPSAVSPVGARGLMQLMPATAAATARNLRISKPSSSSLLLPHVNIRLGAHHVAELMDDFHQNRILVAAAYNAGSSNVRRWLPQDAPANAKSWIERIPYYETRSYVKSVLAFTHVYALLLDHQAPLLTAAEMNIPIRSTL